MVEYTLTKSKRKSISIYVKGGSVFVRAPLRVSKKKIDAYVESKEKWIRKHQQKQIENMQKQDSFMLDYDSEILLFGDTVRVGDVILSNTESSKDLKDQVKKYYKSEAKKYITSRVHEISEQMNLKPANIRITSAKTRWGSCSSRGNVNFSWYLIMASEDEIDYVIVHELAHLKEMNHSQRFWKIVEEYMPDWKVRRKALRDLQGRLVTENWD